MPRGRAWTRTKKSFQVSTVNGLRGQFGVCILDLVEAKRSGGTGRLETTNTTMPTLLLKTSDIRGRPGGCGPPPQPLVIISLKSTPPSCVDGFLHLLVCIVSVVCPCLAVSTLRSFLGRSGVQHQPSWEVASLPASQRCGRAAGASIYGTCWMR